MLSVTKTKTRLIKKLCTESYLATPAINILMGLKITLIKSTFLQDSHTSVHGLIQNSASYLVVVSGSKQDVSLYFHGSFLSAIFSLHNPNALES